MTTQRILLAAFLSIGALAADASGLSSLAELETVLADVQPRSDSFSVEGTVTIPTSALGDEFVLFDGNIHLVLTDGVSPAGAGLKAGERIRAEGHVIRQTSAPYNYAKAFSIKRLGTGPVPAPLMADAKSIAAGKTLNRLVQTQGLLMDVFRDEIDPRFLFFVLKDRQDYVYLSLHATNDVSRLLPRIGARVKVTGVCRQERPGHSRQHLGIILGLHDATDLVTIIPAPLDPFLAPELCGNVQQLQAATTSDTPWRKVRGTVLAVFRRNQVMLQREDGSVSYLTLASENRPRPRPQGHHPRPGERKLTAMNPIRILLVDDHAVMRMGLASLLGSLTEFEIVADAGSGEEALRKAAKLKPDVVLMDLMMPGIDGVECTRRMRESVPGARVLILTTFGTADALGHALDAGATGALLKNAGLKELSAAIKAVASGKRSVSEEIEQILSEEPPLPELSPRQLQILDSITRGLSNEDISQQFGISVSVVKGHLNALCEKIGAANRTEAVAIALRKHLLKM